MSNRFFFISFFLSVIGVNAQDSKEVRCGDVLKTFQGTIFDTSSTRPAIKFNYNAIPKLGAVGEMSLVSKSGNFNMSFGLGKVKVIEVKNDIVAFDIIKAKGEVTINGVKRNNYRTKGKEVKFEEYEYGYITSVADKWPSGQLKSKGTLKCNKEIGEWEHYYEDGSEKSKYEYDRKDKLTNDYIEYYSNGQIKLSGYYRDGKKYYTWIEYFDTGKIKSKGYYSNDTKSGKWIEHNTEGKKVKNKY